MYTIIHSDLASPSPFRTMIIGTCLDAPEDIGNIKQKTLCRASENTHDISPEFASQRSPVGTVVCSLSNPISDRAGLVPPG